MLKKLNPMDIKMKVENCNIPDVKLISNVEYLDDRGSFIESYKESVYAKSGINYKFIQDNLVYSKKNVLRGLHYQDKHPQGKLVSVLYGEIFDVAVDINKNSKTYLQWVGKKLSKDNLFQLFIPPGYAHGYCVLSDFAIVMYKCTEYYYADEQKGIIWNDNNIGIDWPISNPILSDKDNKLPLLASI